MFRLLLCIKFILFLSSAACAQTAIKENIFDLQKQKNIHLDHFVEEVQPGSILVLGESHAFNGQQNLDQIKQLLLIQKLVQKFKNVSVGMEFINWPFQNQLDQYLNKSILEDDFLKQISWGGSPFKDYKPQILETLKGQGWTYALNAPKELNSYISKNGLTNMPTKIGSLLPPSFVVGNQHYKKRFFDLMGDLSGHGVSGEYYFQAQSVWDDTMAWKAIEIMKSNPKGILVIIVGKFHVQYGGGLPDRIISRSNIPMHTMIFSEEGESQNLGHSNTYLYSPEFNLISDFYW